MRFALAFFLFGWAGVALAGETLGPESVLPVHDRRDAYAPAVAFGKDAYLVVWQSGRVGEGDLTKGIVPIGDIVACRVDPSGKAMDALPLVISGAKDLQEQPQAAFGGGVFLVVWQDLRNEKDWDVYAARVTPDGKVLDRDGILVAGGMHNQALPRLTWDGKAFWVVWQDFRSGDQYEVYGGRVSADGKTLDGPGLRMASGDKSAFHCYAPVTASGGGGKSFTLWVSKGDAAAYGQTPDSSGRFVVDGRPVDGNFITYKEKGHGPAGNANPMTLAAGPEGYLAAWRTDYTAGRGGSPSASTAALFDGHGKRTRSLFLAGKQHFIDAPEACWDGSAYVAVWQENGRPNRREAFPFDAVLAARVSVVGDTGGPVHGVSGSPDSPAREAAVASDGAGASLIAYEMHPEKADVPIRIGLRTLTKK